MRFGRTRARGDLREARLISQAMALEEHTPPGFISYGVFLVVGLILFAILGAAVFPVITSATAMGVVRPIGSVKPVQHVEGGAVLAVYVRDGDIVEKGQRLMRLDSTEAQKRYSQVDAEYWSYVAEAERLRAQADRRAPDFTILPEKHSDLGVAQQRIFHQATQTHANLLAGLKERHAQALSNLRLLQARIEGARGQRQVQAEQHTIYKQLLEKGYTAKVKYLDVRRELLEVESRIVETEAERAMALSAFEEAATAIASFEAERRQQAIDRLGEIAGLVAQVRETRARLAASLQRLEIVAPDAGYVNKLKHLAAGGAVLPGDIVAEIVPVADQMIVEAQVEPRDVGFLNLGQTAKLIIEGFDVARFKPLEGRLTHVSASSFQQDDGASYFLAKIVLEAPALEGASIPHSIRPGMTVAVSITIGERSLLEYLMRPLYDSFGRIFSER